MIKISVVTCTYNASLVLKRTLDSVYNQCYTNIEHIIVDGKSKDQTLSIVEDYKKQIESNGCCYELVVVSEPDKGLYDAMNKAIGLASGDFLVYLNAGDRFHDQNTLAIVAKSVEDSKADVGVVYGETDIVDYDGHFLRKRHHSVPEKLSWRSFKNGMLVCHQSFYVNVSIAKNVFYNLNYKFSADVDWCIRIMKYADKKNMLLVNTHNVLTDFLDGGLTTANHKKSLIERFDVMRRHYGLFVSIFMHIVFVFRSVFKHYVAFFK